jgi:HAMP domain-containing protein
MADERQTPTPGEQVAQLYEQAEAETAKAAERFVGSQGFPAILGQLAENAAAMTKLTSDALDLVLRNVRLAGRRDIVRLARQLARTEDKLERVLQELEAVRDQLERGNSARAQPAQGNGGGNASASKERKAAS